MSKLKSYIIACFIVLVVIPVIGALFVIFPVLIFVAIVITIVSTLIFVLATELQG